MENTFGFAVAVSIIYTLVCFIDTRFLRRESISFKMQIRHSTFVFISSLAAAYLLNSLGENTSSGKPQITAFTGDPAF